MRSLVGGVGRRAYLRFNVQGIQGEVLQAKLRIRTRSVPVEEVSFFRVEPFLWYEYGLNFNNASVQAVLLESRDSLAPDAWYEIDLTGGLEGDGMFHVGIGSTQNSGMNFWSRDSQYRPELIVTWAPNP